jgi:hypothetical protein
MRLKMADRKTTGKGKNEREGSFVISPWSVEKTGVSVIFRCTPNA